MVVLGEAVFTDKGSVSRERPYFFLGDRRDSGSGREIQLYERNKELVEADEKMWLPVSGVTSARPQVYHPTKLRERRVSISGNPQSYVVFYKGKRRGEEWKLEWKLEELAVDEVVSLPEEVLMRGMGYTSLTAVSRNCVSRVTKKVRDMLAKANNQRRVQGTVEGYSRTGWRIYPGPNATKYLTISA
jgi:hypothetical protein